ncbi:MAG: FAD-dependent oxidoreductase [Calditrichaeota bacterium]|nr:FAD-dependent oxidoreductase [Calditrichota bacterium]MBT7789541.1 FAD-dependent oxidoreductase [Calditrichota bacterium]
MNNVKLTIDGQEVSVPEGLSVRKAAIKNGIYIPGLCSHPELDSFKPFNWSESIWQGEKLVKHDNSAESEDDFPHCDLCMVSINGEAPVRSCSTHVANGMSVDTANGDVISARRKSLKKILARHPHACLTCAQREGCDRVQCSMNVPVEERCCELLGRCEIGKVSIDIGIPGDTPAYRHEGRPGITDEPLILRNYELCINCLRCVRVCRDVRGVDALGAVSNDQRVNVGTIGGMSLPESDCRLCGACVELCPTGALLDQPDIEVLVDGMAPCQAGCPLHIDVPGYLELIASGHEHDALELIRQRAVLPGVLGYACFHPCEDNCRRKAIDDSASICALKRYAAEFSADKPPQIIKRDSTEKKIAVIGGGPAGLAASAELLRRGHSVTIFERDSKLGGMLRQTIPNFRLPEEVIDRDLEYLFALGLETRFGKFIGDDDLKAEGFDALIRTVGLPDGANLGIEGENLANVGTGLDFLRDVQSGDVDHVEGEVLIIGGGAVAVDVAMTARRLGAETVLMVSLEAQEDMPAFKEELDTATEEGIFNIYQWGVDKIEGEDSRFKRVLLKRCTRVFDDHGRFRPEYNTDENMTVRADRLIIAIGQKPDSQFADIVRTNKSDAIAGDAAMGASSIVKAMADGVRAAIEVNNLLKGPDAPEYPEYETARRVIGREPGYFDRGRVIPLHVEADVRAESMEIFVETIGQDQARAEAARCLRCNLRAKLSPTPLPPDLWKTFNDDVIKFVPEEDGVLILANEDKVSVKIAGTANLNEMVEELLDEDYEAEYCRWELDPMYTKRESELIQAHLQAYGEIPGDDDMDDLF